MAQRLLTLLAVAALATTAFGATCPPKGQTLTSSGTTFCVFCESGATAQMNFGGADLSCSCSDGTDCSVTANGKAATLQDFIDASTVTSVDADNAMNDMDDVMAPGPVASSVSETVSEAVSEASNTATTVTDQVTSTVTSSASGRVGTFFAVLSATMLFFF